ncbi:hypothetical protein IWZ01DRAFT_113003 [Phyllosticta capitalensis]
MLAGPFTKEEEQEIENAPEAQREAVESKILDKKVNSTIEGFTDAEKGHILMVLPDQVEEDIFLELFPQFMLSGTGNRTTISDDQMNDAPLAVVKALRKWKGDDSYVIPHEEGDHIVEKRWIGHGVRALIKGVLRSVFRTFSRMIRHVAKKGLVKWRGARRIRMDNAREMAAEDAWIQKAIREDQKMWSRPGSKRPVEDHRSAFEAGLSEAERAEHLKALDRGLEGRPGASRLTTETRMEYHRSMIEADDVLEKIPRDRLPHLVLNKKHKLDIKATRKEWREYIRTNKEKKWFRFKHKEHGVQIPSDKAAHKADLKWHEKVYKDLLNSGTFMGARTSSRGSHSGSSFSCSGGSCSSFGSSGTVKTEGTLSSVGTEGTGSLGSGVSVRSVGSVGSLDSIPVIMRRDADDAHPPQPPQEVAPPALKKPWKEIEKELDRLTSASKKTKIEDWAKAHSEDGMAVLKRIADTEGYEFEMHLCPRDMGCMKPKKLLKVLKKLQKTISQRPKQLEDGDGA